MIDVEYVRDIMDKDNRRSTPIKTLDSENRKEPNYKVRQNAGDSIEDVEKESTIYRENEEKGINPQSLDAIDQNGDNNIEVVKERIVSNAIEEGEMSRQQLRQYIEKGIEQSNLSITNEEKQRIANEIEERVKDESRFPVKGPKTNG